MGRETYSMPALSISALPTSHVALPISRIVIRSSSSVIQHALGRTMSAEYPDAAVICVTTLSEVREHVADHDVDLLLLHLSHTGTGKHDEVRALREMRPGMKVLAI